MRVWKGNLRTRDLTKIRCGNPENDKYLDGIRDLTAAPYLSNTLTNLCKALYCILLYCVVLNCIVLFIYCYVDIIQYNAMHKFVGVLDNPLLPGKRDWPKFGHGMRDFFLRSVGNSGNCNDPNKRPSGRSRWCLLSNQTIECAWLIRNI